MAEIAIGIGLIIIFLPFLFGALKERGYLKTLRLRRRPSAFRQFPLHPIQDEDQDLED